MRGEVQGFGAGLLGGKRSKSKARRVVHFSGELLSWTEITRVRHLSRFFEKWPAEQPSNCSTSAYADGGRKFTNLTNLQSVLQSVY